MVTKNVGMKDEVLHLLNGESMLHVFNKSHFLKGETLVPFNEAMCYGKTSADIFSPLFNKKRAKVHHITVDEYNERTSQPLQPLFLKNFNQLELWFDFDMFCQINLLTVLGWLDQEHHSCSIKLHLVDDQFKPIEEYSLTSEGYYLMYKQVLVDKKMPSTIELPPLLKGIEWYLSYLKEDSDLMEYILLNFNTTESELLLGLLNEFKHYGLGDTQYLEIIRDLRRK
ncbi:hypothetical protein ACIQ34_08850 [Ureibacillus sp. NPDC094379]